MNKEFYELMESAREVINGEMNCHTPEFRAIELLYQAIKIMARAIENEVERNLEDFS